jgi:hypothetical protein
MLTAAKLVIEVDINGARVHAMNEPIRRVYISDIIRCEKSNARITS